MAGTRGTGAPLSVTVPCVTGLPGPQGPAASSAAATEGAAAEKCARQGSQVASPERRVQQEGTADTLWGRVQVSEGPPGLILSGAPRWWQLCDSLSRALTCDPSCLLVLSRGVCEAFGSPSGGPQRRGLSGCFPGGETQGGPVRPCGLKATIDGRQRRSHLCLPGTLGQSGPCSRRAVHHAVMGN